MKKAKKGLLLSLLTLLMAVAVTATSTYAWFAVNRSVQATNMNVTLKSDTTYLVIGTAASAPATADAIGTSTTAAATASNAQVLPVRYNEDATPTSGNSKWETAVGTNYSTGTAKNSTYTPVATANIGNYAVKYTFYVGLTSTTSTAQANLRVTALTAAVASQQGVDAGGTVFLPAVSALVVCGDTAVDFEDITAPNANINTDDAIILSSLTVNTVYTVDVYVYINGDNAAVTSANATEANLGAYTVTMTLGIDE